MQRSGNGDGDGSNNNNSGSGGDDSIGKEDDGGSNSSSGSTMAAATIEVAAAAVAMTAATAPTSGGDCGGCGIGEAESLEGGMVLGGGIGRGAVDKPMEEGAGEGGGIVVVIANSTAEVVDSCPPC
jgi:hypothetical protein